MMAFGRMASGLHHLVDVVLLTDGLGSDPRPLIVFREKIIPVHTLPAAIYQV
jgi:hypothetical protein